MREVHGEVYVALHVKCPLFMYDLTKTGTGQQIIVKLLSFRFNENPFSRS